MNYILPPKFSLHMYFNKLNVKLRLPMLTNCDYESAVKDPENIFCKNHEDVTLSTLCVARRSVPTWPT